MGLTEFSRFFRLSSANWEGVSRLGGYGRNLGVSSKITGGLDIRSSLELAYKHCGHSDRTPPGDRQATDRSLDWRRSSAYRRSVLNDLWGVSWHFRAT